MNNNQNSYNSRRVTWGIIIIVLGGLILLHTTGIINTNFNWARYLWPLALLIPGINLLVGRRNPSLNSALVLFTVLGSVFLALAFNKRNGFARLDNDERMERAGINRLHNDNHSDADDDDDDDNDKPDFKQYHYTEALDSSLATPKYLNLNIGGGEVKLGDATDSLFSAAVKTKGMRYTLLRQQTDTATTLTLKNSGTKIGFNDKGNNFDFGTDKVDLHLNKNATWHINFNGGVGSTELDVKDYRVRAVDYNGGVGKLELKVGQLLPVTDVRINSGLSDVEVKIPKSSGCRIISKSGLTSEDYEGFINRGNGVYETPNYAGSAQKVFIYMKGGLSNFSVNQYD